jgi:hypothetical protein
MHALAAQGATVRTEQIVCDTGFVEKHETRRIPDRRRGVPHDTRGRDARPIVFGRPYRFLLTVTSRSFTARQIVAMLAGVPSASLSPASVRSGCSAISAAKV